NPCPSRAPRTTSDIGQFPHMNPARQSLSCTTSGSPNPSNQARGLMVSLRLRQRPRLSTHTRLQYDSESQAWSLRSPERILRLNPSATEVVQRCTGELTVQEIVVDLLDSYALQHALGGGASATQVAA